MQNNKLDDDILKSLDNANNSLYFSESLNDIFNIDEKIIENKNSFIKFKNSIINIDKLITLKIKKNKFNIVLCINNKSNSGSILDMPELININIMGITYELSKIKLNKIENKTLTNKDIYIISYTCKNIKEIKNEW